MQEPGGRPSSFSVWRIDVDLAWFPVLDRDAPANTADQNIPALKFSPRQSMEGAWPVASGCQNRDIGTYWHYFRRIGPGSDVTLLVSNTGPGEPFRALAHLMT